VAQFCKRNEELFYQHSFCLRVGETGLKPPFSFPTLHSKGSGAGAKLADQG